MEDINDEHRSAQQLPILYIFLSAIFFITFSFIAFKKNIPYLFYGLDGQYMLNLVKEDFFWRGLEFGLTNNFLQSIGTIWFPMHTMVIPGYALSFLISDIYFSKIIAYVIFSFEFFIIGLILSRAIGLGWRFALLAAWLLPLLSYPYYGNPILYPIMALVPHFGTCIAIVCLLFILFLYLGKYGMIYSMLAACGIVFLVLYLAIAMPAILSICAPIIFISCMVYLFSTTVIDEKKIKIISSPAILFTLIAMGVFSYFYGVIKFTAAHYFASDLLNDRMSWYYVSILFHNTKESAIFVVAFLGIIYSIIFGNQNNKTIALGILITMIAIIGFGALTVFYNFWHGPSPLYFELFLWPFYVVYSIVFMQCLFLFFEKIVQLKWKISIFYLQTPIIALATIVLPWLIFLLPSPILPNESFSHLPTVTPIVEVLRHDLSLAPGDIFKGRVANFTGRKLKDAISWFDLHSQDFVIYNKLGNEHRMNGFWSYNIPTLDVYNPLISPTYYQFSKFFFALPKDHQLRNVMTLRNPNIRWLRSLGVKYVVTDLPIKTAMEVKKISLDDMGDLFLYQLPAPNIGQYSPTQVIQSANSRDTLKILSDNNFNPENQMVTDYKMPANLVQAKNGRIIVEKGFLRISASSTGYSLLVLPLEFSRCLTLSSFTIKTPVLLRANLTQTAVLFQNQLDVKIRYFTGPFYHSSCRLEDAIDFERIN